MIPTPPDLSVVIVSWNTRALLAACLASLYDPPPACTLETIVVDNASTDGSAALVRERFPQVRLIEKRDNPGFAAANNQGIRQSTGRAVLLLNPDTELRPGALDALLRALDAVPRAAIAGARLLNPDGSLQPSCFPEPTLAREAWRLLHLDRLRPYALYRMGRWPTDAPRAVDVVQGAALLVRRAVLDEVGLLDEGFFIYSEEVDLCLRARRAGWTILWEPRAQVIHHGGQSTRQVAAPMFLRLYEAKTRYFRKHHGARAARLYKAILVIAALLRLAATPVAWLRARAGHPQALTNAQRYGSLLRALPRF